MKLAVIPALLSGLFCMTLSAAADAQPQAVFWAAPGGSGTACTKYRPCSASYAARTAVAGQTWYFKPGIYRLASPLVVGNSGEPDAPIVFRTTRWGKRKAVLDGAGWKAVEKSHFRINGFKIQNVGGDGIRVECRPRTVCDDIRIENNWTLNTRFSGIAVHGGLFQWGQYGTDNVTNLVIARNRVERANTGGVTENISISNGINGAEIAHNEVIDGYNLGIDAKAGVRNVKIHHNRIVGHRGTSIYLDSNRRYVEDVRVYANRIIGGRGTAGIRLAREVWNPAKAPAGGPRMERVRIYNNVIDHVPGSAIVLQQIRMDAGRLGTFEDITIANNTIVRSTKGVVVANHPRMRNIVVRNNLVRTGGASYVFHAPVISSHNISSDGSEETHKAAPAFMNLARKNYRLRSGSPGVDQGTDADAPVLDFDQLERAAGLAFDIGAFER